MDAKQKKDILVTCQPGLSEYLTAELEAMSMPIIDTHPGGVLTRGSIAECMKLNYTLRTAFNVLYLLRKFRCGSVEALYKQVSQIDWENIIPPSEKLCVISNVNTFCVDNSMYASMKVKDAVVDRIAKKCGSRPDSGPDRGGVVINLFWNEHDGWIYLNTSGEKICDRNYRKMPHKAPLRENLAAALITETGYNGSENLVLPMCGSGTLAIEAVMKAQNRPAGALRTNFGFMHTKFYDEKLWQQIKKEASKNINKAGISKPIIATDIDPAAIEASRQNAKTAGVEGLIEFDVCDFEKTPVPQPGGIVLINPEYGLRLGDTEKLEQDYKRIGAFLKNQCPGYAAFIFSGNRQLVAKIGLAAAGKKGFYNGKIPCRLYEYKMYKGSKKN